MNTGLVVVGPTQASEATAETRVSLFRVLFDFPRAARGVQIRKPVEGGGSTTVRKHNGRIVVRNVSLRIQKVPPYDVYSYKTEVKRLDAIP